MTISEKTKIKDRIADAELKIKTLKTAYHNTISPQVMNQCHQEITILTEWLFWLQSLITESTTE